MRKRVSGPVKGDLHPYPLCLRWFYSQNDPSMVWNVREAEGHWWPSLKIHTLPRVAIHTCGVCF